MGKHQKAKCNDVLLENVICLLMVDNKVFNLNTKSVTLAIMQQICTQDRPPYNFMKDYFSFSTLDSTRIVLFLHTKTIRTGT